MCATSSFSPLPPPPPPSAAPLPLAHGRYNYPSSRSAIDPADAAATAAAGTSAAAPPRGVAGTVELLNAKIVCPQPVVAWDWCADKEGLAVAACLDQTLRVFIVTRLGRL